MFGRSNIYALDIETDTTINGLDPRVSAVTEVVLSVEGDDFVFAGEDETAILNDLDYALGQLAPGLISTWNGVFFDLPFLDHRRHVLELDSFGLTLIPAPGLIPKYALMAGYDVGQSGIWLPRGAKLPHQHIDIMFPYKKVAEDLGVKHSLKPVCIARGIDMIEVDREKMHLLTPEQREAYVTSDGRGTRQLTLEWLGVA